MLVIDPGAVRLQAPAAVLYGCRRIDKVETDPLIARHHSGRPQRIRSGDIYGDLARAARSREVLAPRKDRHLRYRRYITRAVQTPVAPSASPPRITGSPSRPSGSISFYLKRDGSIGHQPLSHPSPAGLN
ncbi:MAG: hypothetical protein MZV70_28530 [Desulfobacterales bacterium]|nr:hypothetical protein [Desulfobacterales bacterium]